MTITFVGREPSMPRFKVANETDHNVEVIHFELPEIADGQVAVLNVILANGNVDAITLVNGDADITRDLSNVPGIITGWVTIYDGTEKVWNSNTFFMDVSDLPNISDAMEEQYPTAFQQAIAATSAAQQAAENAQAGAEDARDEAITARDTILGMSATAETLPPRSDATATYEDGVLTIGVPVGEKGDKGDKGDQGERGERGEQGIQGPRGPQGARGPQGVAGPQGPKGDQGEKGDKGDTGERGGTGNTGATGTTYTPYVSPDGIISWENDGGKQNPGSVNITGPRGLQGEQGEKGDQGDAGMPPIIQGGYWYSYDNAAGQYVNTGVPASGVEVVRLA